MYKQKNLLQIHPLQEVALYQNPSLKKKEDRKTKPPQTITNTPPNIF